MKMWDQTSSCIMEVDNNKIYLQKRWLYETHETHNGYFLECRIRSRTNTADRLIV